MDSTLAILVIFFLSLILSAIIIYFVTKLFGETEGFGTAMLASFFGAILYVIIYYFLRPELGWVALIIGGIAWLFSLRFLYNVGWLKALGIAILIWIFNIIISLFLPVALGPY